MAIKTLMPDLLDFTDPATRKRLSPAGLHAFFNLAQKWDLQDTDAMALLEESPAALTTN